MPVDVDSYAEIVSRVNKKYNGALKQGDKIENPSRLSTGSLELDLAMGGGVPVGRVTRLAGPYSSGKSLTGWSIIRSAQKAGLKCAYYNVEKQYTPEFVSERGVNIDDLTVVDATTIESIAEICESLLGAVHLHVIDSTKAAVSEDALNASVRDWRPGLEARAWGKAFAFLNDKFDYTENIIVLIDQVRIKNFQTGSEEPAGGRVMDHASSMTVMFRKGSWLFYDEEGNLSDKAKQQKNSDNQSIPAGRIIQARVEKSRVSRPLLPATMWLDLNTNFFDRPYELQKAGLSTGLVTNSGSMYYFNDPVTGEQLSFKGKKPLREFLGVNEIAQEQIRAAALSALRR
jgi:recombination protein RecA